MENIFSILTGVNWKQDKAEYKRYKQRIHALPKDYQIVMKEMENILYTYSSDTDSTMVIYEALQDVLELFETNAQEGKDVLDVVGQDVGGFCDDLLHELQIPTWTGQKKAQLNQTIREKLGKGE
ncbi:DUF1048 domain-containing protein [Shimazuella kribbensis]|uniref:DUF1048 domain-containing protein n=1 Tax=Shimazuella kribbensis TaxID=139808 RepID=UPI00041EB1E6|nr:DUF1048 domain-containing protein [Shimazuella kribbensis]